MLTACSLFTGIGGIDLALVASGFTIILQAEIDPFCREVLKKHEKYWKQSSMFTDVRHVSADSATYAIGCDVIAGGFPCQPHSQAGHILGEDDPRELWGEFARIIDDLRPRAILLENVPNITNTIGLRIVGNLTKMGYDSTWGIIPASDVGASHNRARWWLVAYANGKRLETERNELGQNRIEGQLAGEIQGNGRALISHRATDSISVYLDDKNGDAPFYANRMVRRNDGIPSWLHKHQFPPAPGNWQPIPRIEKKGTRKARIKALGNAVVPQLVLPLAQAIFNRLSNS